MDKYSMRDWVSMLESTLDQKLKKWKKENRNENGEVVQLWWTFEQTHIKIDIFWNNNNESVRLHYLSPRGNHDFLWHGLTEKTFDRVNDRIGNLAQVTMYPPIEPDTPQRRITDSEK